MDVVPMSGATPYSISGNWPVVSLALVLVGVFGWRSFEGRRVSLDS
jgi:apolipoprotein N-acyltransferase